MELKDVKNLYFVNFTNNTARVEVEDELRSIKFNPTKVGNKVTFEIVKGEEYCQV